MLQQTLSCYSNRTLFFTMLAADAVVFGCGIPLERYSLMEAADKNSTALMILALLTANVLLLAILLFAIAVSSVLMTRTINRFFRKRVAVVRGEIDTRGNPSSVTKTPPN